MSKNTINMQLSQLTRGEVDGDDFDDDGDNVVELGYKPSIIHFYVLAATDDILARGTWYEHQEDNLYLLEQKTDTVESTESDNYLDAHVDTTGVVSVDENGFTVDGSLLDTAMGDGTPSGFTFEAYGGNRIDSECPVAEEAHPDAVESDTAMDTVDYLPEL